MTEEYYKKQKEKIRNLLNKFDLTDNLIHLAKAVILANNVLKENQFPFKEYLQYINEKKETKKAKRISNSSVRRSEAKIKSRGRVYSLRPKFSTLSKRDESFNKKKKCSNHKKIT